MALTDNIVAYYKFEWNANDSASTNNWTSNNITFSSGNGKILQGGGFNGTSSNITVPTSAWLEITWTWISFSFWIYPTANLTNNGVLFKGASSSQWNYSCWFFYGSAMRMLFRLNGSISEWSWQATSSSNVSQNVWTHVACTYNGSTQKIYFNWTEVWSQSYSSSISSDTNSLILWYYYWQAYDFQWNIDEVGIWNRWLTSSEVTELYNWWAWISYPFTPSVNSNFFLFF